MATWTAEPLYAVDEERGVCGRPFDASRYFCETHRLMHFGGRTFALINQWGGETHHCIEALLAAFPECGVSVLPNG